MKKLFKIVDGKGENVSLSNVNHGMYAAGEIKSMGKMLYVTLDLSRYDEEFLEANLTYRLAIINNLMKEDDEIESPLWLEALPKYYYFIDFFKKVFKR